jgi:hypothetical protein
LLGLSARLKPCPDEKAPVVLIFFAIELGFEDVKSRSLAALGMTTFAVVEDRDDG